MKIFVTGVTGQLGFDVARRLLSNGHIVIGSGSRPQEMVNMRAFVTGVAEQAGNELQERGHYAMSSDVTDDNVAKYATGEHFIYEKLDITEEAAVKNAIEKSCPDVIIHCAAWTAVDAAEDEKNKPKVEAVNHLGTKYIAEAAKAVDSKMVYISTDYVFDGQGERPWQPDDKNYSPLNFYGKTKLAGELEVSDILTKYFIIRIAWVFGNGKNFVKTMIQVGKTHDMVRVVNDQIGTPTYTFDLARLLADMMKTEKYGFYHATNEGGYISWYDFCVEFYRQYGLQTQVIPVTTAEYGLSKAPRPFNSRLDKSKLLEEGFEPLPNWKNAVARYLKEAQL